VHFDERNRLHAGLIWPESLCRQWDSGFEGLRDCATRPDCGIMARSNDQNGGIPMSADTATAERLRDLTLAQANRVIALAEAYKAHLIRALGANPEADKIAQDVQSGSSAEGLALVSFIEGLTRAERSELVGLVWFGMGDHEPFSAAREYARATADAGIAQYLTKKALVLPDYLRKALATVG
jgi:hypothetical protein